MTRDSVANNTIAETVIRAKCARVGAVFGLVISVVTHLARTWLLGCILFTLRITDGAMVSNDTIALGNGAHWSIPVLRTSLAHTSRARHVIVVAFSTSI